jgi:predicted dehydrogenase
MHAAMLTGGPETELAGVWARRPQAAEDLAQAYGVKAFESFPALLDACEAVAFAVPPAVQAPLARQAAAAGKALLLEKPLSLELEPARELVAAIDAAGVVSQLVLTKRYHPSTVEFLSRAAAFPTDGARMVYAHGAFLGGEFATGWRLERGALYDLGPHALDLLDAAIGPIRAIRAVGDPRRWVEVTCEHDSGRVSQVSLSGSVGVPRSETEIRLYGRDGVLAYDIAAIDHSECWPHLRRSFAAAVRSGVPTALDAHRGLMLQELIVRAAASLE